MGEIAGMGPVDYALPPLCLFYLMPKTADNFKNLGQLIMRSVFFPSFFPFLLSFAVLCIHSFRMLRDTRWWRRRCEMLDGTASESV